MPDNYIDLIYCDILYNTGKNFEDYNDNLGTSIDAIKWYEPRLIEMHRILKDTGSIYLQCDWRLIYYLKIEMDSIFGFDNFRNEIVWNYATPSQSKTFVKNTDRILLYTKSNTFIFNTQYMANDKHENKIKSYLFEEDGNLYYYRGRNLKNSEYIRKFRTKEFVEDNKLQNMFSKIKYLGTKIGEVWSDLPTISQLTKENTGYSTQKPKALLERIIKASSNEGDIVGDFFMGSGTTGEVAIELGRKFIGCDIGERACEITKNRLDKIII